MKKINKKNIMIIFGVIAAISISGTCYYYHSQKYIYTDDAYISGHSSYISPHVDGYVDKVYVQDNQTVKKGQLLLTIKDNQYVQNVKKAKADLGVAETQLEGDIHLANAEKAKLKFSYQEYYRYQKLVNCRAQSIEVFQSYQSTLKQAIEAYEAKIYQVNNDRETIKQAKAQFELAKINLSYTKIYAPFDGYVTQKTVTNGNYVSPGADLMAIVPNHLYIQANYKETQLTNIKKGQEVTIYIDSYPDVAFKGHVNSIQSGSGAAFSLLPPENATGNFVKVVQRIPVKIEFEHIPNPSKYKLSIGMSTETTVNVG